MEQQSPHTLCKAHIRARRPAQRQSGPLPLSFWHDLSEYRPVCAVKVWRHTVEHSTNGQATKSNTAPVCSAPWPAISTLAQAHKGHNSAAPFSPKHAFINLFLGLMTLCAHPQMWLFECVIVAFIRWCCDSILMISLGSGSVFKGQNLGFILTEGMLATAQSPWTSSFCFPPPLSRHRAHLLPRNASVNEVNGAFVSVGSRVPSVGGCDITRFDFALHVAHPWRESCVSDAVTWTLIRRVPTRLCLGFGVQPRHKMAKWLCIAHVTKYIAFVIE